MGEDVEQEKHVLAVNSPYLKGRTFGERKREFCQEFF